MSYLSPNKPLLTLTLHKRKLIEMFTAHLLLCGYDKDSLELADVEEMISIYKSAWCRAGFKIFESDILFDIFSPSEKFITVGWAWCFSQEKVGKCSSIIIKYASIYTNNYDKLVEDVKHKLISSIEGEDQ